MKEKVNLPTFVLRSALKKDSFGIPGYRMLDPDIGILKMSIYRGGNSEPENNSLPKTW